MKIYIKLLRIKNYIKNLLILLPVIFSKKLFDTQVLPSVILCFISFCMLSSAIYIFNDLCDFKRDKLHPKKSTRPIANGDVSRKSALVIMIFLLVACVITNYLACGTNHIAWILLLVYFAQNILYSLKLKHVPILDVVILVFGFLIRVFYGSQIVGVEVSSWLYLTVLAVSFYLALGKRRNEIVVADTTDTRSVLNFYSYDFLDKNMYVCSALAIVFYSLWCVDPATIENFGSNKLMWTIPIVILICITYSHSVEKCNADDPIEVILDNKLLLALVLGYMVCITGIVYL